MATQISDPQQLFVHKLGATLTMEQTVVTMLKELSGKANDTELKQQLSHHREETEQQIRNLNQIFAALGTQPQTQPCPVIDGLDKEGKETLQQTTPELHDAVILSGCAEVEHHEIAVYDGLITMAEQLDQDDIVALLEENLDQEEHTLKEVEKAFEQQAKHLAEQVTA
jgi:ferritin-like metal-binding protein YciE